MQGEPTIHADARAGALHPWRPWLAALVPLTAYVLTASGHAYWLDSGEFTAAAIHLDISHPPGHPLTSLWGKLFTLLPVGSLPFRVALGQAVAAAIALAAVERAVARSIAFCGLPDGRATALMSIGATWVLGACFGFWFNAHRPEVYALQAMFLCIALERLVKLACEPESRDARPFYVATLALGLSLANHHLMTVLAMPALLVAFVRLARVHGARLVAWGLGTGVVGLLGYAYLPLRAATEPPMDLGHPVSPASIAWVVSARVYAKKLGTEATQPLGERFADLLVILVEDFSPLVPLLALLGLYLLVRRRATWELGYVWGSTAVVSLAGRAYLSPVRFNPDVLGYMLPGFAALVALAVCAVAVLATQLDASRRVMGVLAAVFLLAGGAQLALTAPRASLADFHATDDFDDARRRPLPQDALLVLVTPEAVFRHWGGEAVDALRADVTLVPVPFLGYGETGALLARRHPALKPLLEAYARTSVLPYDELARLAQTRPVLVEGDTRAALDVLPRLMPEGLFFRVPTGPVSNASVLQAALVREAQYGELYRRLGQQRSEWETKKQLLWSHYVDALYFAMRGMNGPALAAVEHGLALTPEAAQLRGLAETLRAAGPRPIDVRPFVVGP